MNVYSSDEDDTNETIFLFYTPATHSCAPVITLPDVIINGVASDFIESSLLSMLVPSEETKKRKNRKRGNFAVAIENAMKSGNICRFATQVQCQTVPSVQTSVVLRLAGTPRKRKGKAPECSPKTGAVFIVLYSLLSVLCNDKPAHYFKRMAMDCVYHSSTIV